MSTDSVPSYMSNLGLDSYGNAGAPTAGVPTAPSSGSSGGLPMAGLGSGMSQQKQNMLIQMLMQGIGKGGSAQLAQLPQMSGAIGGGVAGSI